eukprot:5216839-Lingulodinium_polyedra.AAC.1
MIDSCQALACGKMCIYAREPARKLIGNVATQATPLDVPNGILTVHVDLVCPMWKLERCLKEIFWCPMGLKVVPLGSSGSSHFSHPEKRCEPRIQSCRQIAHLEGAHIQERHKYGVQLHSQVDDELAPPHCVRGRGAAIRGAGGGAGTSCPPPVPDDEDGNGRCVIGVVTFKAEAIASL